MTIALELQQLKKTYPGGVQALRGIDLQVEAGDFYALLGPNGAGKSTLMKILYGICKADEGEILVEGKKVNLRTPKQAIDLWLRSREGCRER